MNYINHDEPNVMLISQGWQCPICKRVYSPYTSMCFYCGNQKIETSTGTVIGSDPSTGSVTYKIPSSYEVTPHDKECL